MTNFQLIIDALKNFIIPTNEIREMAHKRAAKCADCPFNKANFCSKCKCFIPMKVLSVRDKCPDGKW
jgi:hypothetical protein